MGRNDQHNPELDERILAEVLRDTLLGTRYSIVRIRTIRRIYVKRYESMSNLYEMNETAASHQIKNYLQTHEVEQKRGSPKGWVITRALVEKVCKPFDIEVFAIGTI